MLDFFSEETEVPDISFNNFVQLSLKNKDSAGTERVENLYGVRLWEAKLSRGSFFHPGYSLVNEYTMQGRCIGKSMNRNYCNYYQFLKHRNDMDGATEHMYNSGPRNSPV